MKNKIFKTMGFVYIFLFLFPIITYSINLGNANVNNLDNFMFLKISTNFSNFNDTFTEPDGLADNWDVIRGTWNISNNQYKQNDTTLTEHGISVINLTESFEWVDYVIEVEVNITTDYGGAGIIGRYKNSNEYYGFLLFPDLTGWEIAFYKGSNNEIWQGSSYGTYLNNTWYTLKMELTENTINCYVDDNLECSFIESSYIDSGNLV